ARAKRAEAQKTIQATMQGLSDTSAFDTFERMAEKVDAIEAEAEAGVELSGELTGDNLEQKFRKLEAGKGGVDLQLAELKAKMGLAAPAEQKVLTSGDKKGHDDKDKRAALGAGKDDE